MQITLYQVDAFADRLFAGNPAAVCPLESWIEDGTMQAIAMENNLSETAFFVRRGEVYELRWFTPVSEIALAGHPTLATAFVIFEYVDRAAETIRFETRSGELRVRKNGDRLTMDFPSRPPQRCELSEAVAQALGKAPRELWASRDYMAVYDNEDDVRQLKPNWSAVAALDRFAVMVTAPGREVDFVSRFFAPAEGINEDPVTGSAHCTLTPYWAARLGKTSLHARQVSARGGELWLEDRGERVSISGRVVPYLVGSFRV